MIEVKLLFEKIIQLKSNKLIGRTFIYSASAALNSLIAFALLPVLTHYLSVTDYGIIEVFTTIVAFFSGVVLFGGDTLLSKEYFNKDAVNRLLITGKILGGICTAAISWIIFITVLTYCIPSFAIAINVGSDLLYLAIFVSTLNAIIQMFLTYCQLEKNAKLFATVVNSRTIIDISISLIFIMVWGMKWQGRILGILIAAVIFFILVLILFKKRNITISWPATYWNTILFTGGPLIIAHLSGWTGEMINKIMINSMLDTPSVGLYSLGFRFGMIVMMIEAAFSRAWMPYFFENISLNDENANRKIVKVTYIYILGLIIFTLLYGVLGKYLLYFMVDKKFYSASQFILLISIAYCFDGIWKMFIGYLIHHGKTKIYSNIVLFVAILNVILNYYLIKYFGLIGSAWSMTIAYFIGTLLTIYFAVTIHPMPWKKYSYLWR